MCQSMVNIQSPTAEIRRGNKKEEERRRNSMKILWSAQLHRATITIMQQLNSITSIITYCITIQRNLVTSVHHYSMMHNDAIIITTVRHFRTYRTTVTINKHPIKESKFNVQLNQSTLIKHITQIKHRTLTPHVRHDVTATQTAHRLQIRPTVHNQGELPPLLQITSGSAKQRGHTAADRQTYRHA